MRKDGLLHPSVKRANSCRIHGKTIPALAEPNRDQYTIPERGHAAVFRFSSNSSNNRHKGNKAKSSESQSRLRKAKGKSKNEPLSLKREDRDRKAASGKKGVKTSRQRFKKLFYKKIGTSIAGEACTP